MRQFIFIGVALIVIGTIWMFYLQHAEKKFEKSLPKVSQVKTEIQVLSKPDSEVLAPEDTASIPPLNTDTQENVPSTPTEKSYTEKLYEGMVSEIIETPIDFTSEQPQISEDATNDLYASKPWLKPISEMSVEEMAAEVERRKQTLINEFGNTPEVALINKYTTIGALRDGRVTLDRGDGVAYIRAISVLWSAEENVMVFEEFKRMEQNGWHVNPQDVLQGIPGLD